MVTDKMTPELQKAQHVEQENLAQISTTELPTTLADSVSYGPGGIRGLISSPFVFGAAFLASLGGFSFGYDQGVISIVNVMPQFHTAIPEVAPGYAGSSFNKGISLKSYFKPISLTIRRSNDRYARVWSISWLFLYAMVMR